MSIIYLATPTDQFVSADYPAIRQAVRARFSDLAVQLVEPALSGWSCPAWRDAWQWYLHKLAALVVWPRPDLTIGRGVYAEIIDCQATGVPVYVLREPGCWYTEFGLELLGGASYRHWARVQLSTEAMEAGHVR